MGISPFVVEVKVWYDPAVIVDERAVQDIVRKHKEQINQEALATIKPGRAITGGELYKVH